MPLRLREGVVSLAFSVARAGHRLGLQQTGIYRLLRRFTDHWLFRDSSGLPGRFVPAEIDGCRFAVPRSSAFVYVHRNYEPTTRRVLREVLGPGGKMIDVGANLGFLTVPAARRVGPTGHVWAIEPAPDNLAYLRHNLRLNHLDNVSVVECAAGAHDDERDLHLRASGTLHGLSPSENEPTVATTRVRVRPLDEVVSCPVDFVKIDTEGAEMDVLRGMGRLLTESPGITLSVEWNLPALRAAGQDFSALPRHLANLGFTTRVIEERSGSLQPVDAVLDAARRGDLPANWFGNLLATRRRWPP